MSQTQQALVLSARGEALQVQQKAIPQVVPGSAIIKILGFALSPGVKEVLDGKMPTTLTTPCTPGCSAVGRVHALGQDSTALKEGQLVYADFFIKSRDDPDASILQGYFCFPDASSTRLMEHEWRDGCFAEYGKFPLENVYPLDEENLINKMGYTFADLANLNPLFLGMSAMMHANIKAGDTVIVAPATGYFGGGTVRAAVAIGARVIAAGRNEETLSLIADTFKSTGRITTVKFTGDVEADTTALKNASGSSSGVDAFIDWSPPAAAKSTHIAACLAALKFHGKFVMMGGIFANIEIPYWVVMKNSITIYGNYMYGREHIEQTIKLIESGQLKLGGGEGSGAKLSKRYKLADTEKAMGEAASTGFSNIIVVEP